MSGAEPVEDLPTADEIIAALREHPDLYWEVLHKGLRDALRFEPYMTPDRGRVPPMGRYTLNLLGRPLFDIAKSVRVWQEGRGWARLPWHDPGV